MNEVAPSKQDLLDFLESQVTCTFSSNGDNGYPNSATVAFSNNDNLEFVIGTNINSRKAVNIARDEKVAMTITDVERRWTVQLEGNARSLEKEEFNTTYADHHYKKLPFSLPFKDIPDQVNYVIVPIHLKLTEANKKPWEVHEIIP